jgi:hypothetical protein
MQTTIVISRYNENLDWLKELNKPYYNIYIYNKGKNYNFEKSNPNIKAIIPLPNIGRCDHTYLYHIIQNYDKLDEIVVFLPGCCEDWKHTVMKKMLDTIHFNNKATFPVFAYNDKLKEEMYGFYLDHWSSRTSANLKMNNENKLSKASIRPFGKWCDQFLGNRNIRYSQFGGIFSIAKQDITQHPIHFYQRLICEFKSDSNAEVGHYFERSYGAIFHPMQNTIVMLM